MSDILFVAINSRFCHTNLAIRSITRFVQNKNPHIKMRQIEFTITQPILEIIRSIINANSTMVLFSVYVWNSTLTFQIAAELAKLIPHVIIGFGGPEVSYNAKKVLQTVPVDFIIKGEGEEICSYIAHVFLEQKKQIDINADKNNALKIKPIFLQHIKNILGLYFLDAQKKLIFTGVMPPIAHLNDLPFAYTDDGTVNGILSENFSPKSQYAYYESSRGCPFNCIYCLSSVAHNKDTHTPRVRFLPLERVLAEIDFFLKHQFKTVKFVDRTFNLGERYIQIWKHIAQNHNGITVFHFEVDAQYLCNEAFEVLQKMPSGSIQFEIGIQTTNTKTLKTICRSANLQKTAQNIARIPPSIHVHIDLIAGLPHEDFESFKKSFTFAAHLNPHMLQLGFLKVLFGTKMQKTALKSKSPNHTYEFLSIPPYEVLQTPTLSYAELSTLKDIEHLLDIFYNSRFFERTFFYINTVSKNLNQNGLFDFLHDFALFLGVNQIYAPRTVQNNFAVLHDFIKSYHKYEYSILYDLLRFDFMRINKIGTFPEWFTRHYTKEKHADSLAAHVEIFLNAAKNTDFGEQSQNPMSSREKYARSDYEEFDINPISAFFEKQKTRLLFVYPQRAATNTQNYSTEQTVKSIIL